MPPRNIDILDSFRLCYGIIKDSKKEENMNKKMKDVNCVCIVKDGNEVKAVAMKNVNNVFLDGHNIYTDADSALSGSKIVATAKAKCGPNDIYDFNIGAKLAMDRLYEGYDMTPKPKRKPYNGKIFVEKYPGSILRDHRIYQVNNGRIDIAMCKGCHEYIFDDMTDLDLSFTICHHLYDKYCDPITFNHCVIAFFVKG